MADTQSTRRPPRFHPFYRDLTGQTFDRLTVISRVDGKSRPYWLCRCACDHEKVVMGKHLTGGLIRSCGCVRKERTAKTGAAKAIDRIGGRFGRLLVISRAPNRGRASYWNCLCDCRKETVVSGNNLKCGGIVSCGCARGREAVRSAEVRKATQAYWRRRWDTDPRFRVEARVRAAVHQSLKKRGSAKQGSLWAILGYTCDQLEARLRRTMPPGHTWKDFMSGFLHIDHRIPLAAFNFERETDGDFKRAWALSNLQLLPGPDNMRKGAKLIYPFQPSLLL